MWHWSGLHGKRVQPHLEAGPAVTKKTALVLGLAAAIALDTALQLSWKVFAVALPDNMGVLEALAYLLVSPVFYGLLFLMAAQLVNWLMVLERADLSFAKPVASLSKVTVCVLSVIYLGERLTPLKLLGVLVVIAGVWCVCRTGAVTAGTEAAKT
jgi:drug/metabolite transporter (DMT)-like permease